ncbi:MAG: V-type ATP synthase subunit E [Chlamydiia bacterium]|nr:V-type ATP synthase subunit E [Chlamydiia bacterium]
MKSVDTGKEKVKKICEVLKKETIDPAKKEGEAIVAKAHAEAEKIVENARKEAARIHDDAKRKIEEERNVFQASIHLAAKKGVDQLKQEIEQNLFSPELKKLLGAKMNEADVVAQLISAIVGALEKEGVSGDLIGIVSKEVDVKAVNQALLKGIAGKLKGNGVEIGEIEGGAQVKIVDENLTIDLSEDATKKLLARFVRDDFRSVIFASKS